MEEKDTNQFEQEMDYKQPEQGPAEQKPQPQKVRRVGTFTMGCVMIFAGIAILCYSFFGIGNLMLLAKLAPVVLVVLGIEVLVASFGHTAKLKYDVFGVVLSGLIVCGVVMAAIGYQWFYLQEPQRLKAERMAEDYISDTIYHTVKKDGIEHLSVHVSYPVINEQTGDINEILKNSTIRLDFELTEEYAQPHALAEKGHEINQTIKEQFGQVGLHSVFATYNADNEQTEQRLSLYSNGLYAFEQDSAHLEKQVETMQTRQEQMDEFEIEIQGYEQRIEQMQQEWEQEKAEYEQRIAELSEQRSEG